MRFGRATLLLLLPAAICAAVATRALGAEADSLTTAAGERVAGRKLVLSGGKVLLETASGSVRRVPVAGLSAFSVTGKRKLVTATGEDLFRGIGAVCDDLTFFHKRNAPSIMIEKMKIGA